MELHKHTHIGTHTYTLARSNHRNAIPLNVALVLSEFSYSHSLSDLIFR